ncbi:hypothetical protein SpCBS45565_g02171 [Spizellomyces sp. 'palustris']|nr:hypothetical protein SpCBS45565_g02171 [Spizellomyces sp. 'palustris']
MSLNLASPKRSSVGAVAKLFLKTYTHLHTFNEHALLETILHQRHRPVITVGNHLSVLDDPMLWGILPWKLLTDQHRMRWSLGAKEICFGNRVTAWFFGSGRVIPIVRGDGIYQPAMDLAIQKLNKNGWVHIFSEGRVNQESTMLPFRWGIARLIMELSQPPIVVPFWHKGLESVMPENTKFYFPRPNKEVILAFGEPIDFGSNGILDSVKGLDDTEARIRLTDYVFQRTVQVQRDTERKIGDPDWRTRGRPLKGVDDEPPKMGDPS